MAKKKRNDIIWTLGAFVLLAALVAGTAYYKKQKFEKAQAEDEAKKIVDLNIADVSRIVIENEEGTISFARRKKDNKGRYQDEWAHLSEEFDSISAWTITEPYKSLPDFYSMKNFIEQLDDIELAKTIQEKGERAKDYNLAQPPLKLSFYSKGSNKPHYEIKVGDQNSAESGLYLQTSANPRIVLAGNTLNYLKTRAPADWRKKEILGIKKLDHVKEATFEYNGNKNKEKYSIKQVAGEWQILEPESLPGDKDAIKNVLSNLKSLRMSEVKTEDVKGLEKEYGLHRPYAEISFVFKGTTSNESRTLFIGNKFEGDKDIFVKRSDFPQVFAVKSSLKKDLTFGLEDIVNKKPFAMVKQSIDKLTLSTNSTTAPIELLRDDDNWMMKSPVEDVANEEKVSTLLSSIVGFKAETYIGKALPKEAKKKHFMLEVNAGKKTTAITFFDSHTEGKVFAELREPKLVYEVSKEIVNSLGDKFDDLRDRRILPIDSNELASVTLSRSDVQATFTKKEDNEWVLGTLKGASAPLRVKLKGKDVVKNLLRDLENLEIDSFVGGKNVDEKKADSIVLEFRPKTGSSLSWVLGAKEGDKVHARSVQRKVVGTLSIDSFHDIEELLKNDPKG